MVKSIVIFLRENVINFLLIVGVSYAFFHLLDTGHIKSFVELDKAEHFSILSIALLFGGFLFTGLGIILSGLNSARIVRLNKYGYMDKYYYLIYLALICNIVTIMSAIILISSMQVLYFVAIIEQWMLYLSITLFIKCMLDLGKIIEKIRKE